MNRVLLTPLNILGFISVALYIAVPSQYTGPLSFILIGAMFFVADWVNRKYIVSEGLFWFLQLLIPGLTMIWICYTLK